MPEETNKEEVCEQFVYSHKYEIKLLGAKVGSGGDQAVGIGRPSVYGEEFERLLRRIFDIVPGLSEGELSAFLSRLRGKNKVRVVCIDLSSPYRRLVRRNFPRAKIMADRFLFDSTSSNFTGEGGMDCGPARGLALRAALCAVLLRRSRACVSKNGGCAA